MLHIFFLSGPFLLPVPSIQLAYTFVILGQKSFSQLAYSFCSEILQI